MKYLNKVNLLKLKNISKRYTPHELFYKVVEKLQMPYRDYPTNYKKYMPTQQELKKQRGTIFERRPLISIVVPAYETDRIFLKQMVDSVVELLKSTETEGYMYEGSTL